MADGTPPTRPLNRREQAKAASRAKVIEAAREAFTTVGFAQATMREIAALAGLSTGAIFNSFDSKDELWTAVFGGPPPDLALADQLARIRGELPTHNWTLSCHGDSFFASVHTRDFHPVDGTGKSFTARRATAAEAISAARAAALQDWAMTTIGRA